ncbi:hypothetical protein J2T13_000864 [Paenibacillus sp. DS2015]|uniref:P27 family phage terminase small subunit n=1 Tax=Paenibacillus sp. DS2015 TaxID=3373917 RepID=UPI003D1A0F6A
MGKQDALRNEIERDLTKQLKEKEVVGAHYGDIIQDYLSLWDLKCELNEDIQNNGIRIPGMHGPKSNPSINDLHKTNDRMLKILEALGLKASPIEPITPEKKRSPNDLI